MIIPANCILQTLNKRTLHLDGLTLKGRFFSQIFFFPIFRSQECCVDISKSRPVHITHNLSKHFMQTSAISYSYTMKYTVCFHRLTKRLIFFGINSNKKKPVHFSILYNSSRDAYNYISLGFIMFVFPKMCSNYRSLYTIKKGC